MEQRITQHLVNRIVQGSDDKLVTERFLDQVVREFPVTIFFNEQELVTLLCTPEYLEDLGVGFLSSEGLLKDLASLVSVKADYQTGQVWVNTSRPALVAEKTFMKRYLTTGCGKGTTFYHVMDAQMCTPVKSSLQVSARVLLDLIRQLQLCSELYRETGGVHSAALCSAKEMLLYREDIGRHNAVDKIIGHCFREQLVVEDKFLVTSGRISSEILIKVAKQGIPILVSRSAPTDLALKVAEEVGVTVVGFARGRRLNVYTHGYRITLE